MSNESLRRILLTTGYIKEADKDAVYNYIQDLLSKINSLEEQLDDEREVRELYYKPKSEYEIVGMQPEEF